MMQRILELEDYEVRTADCGDAAIKLFNELNPSLVLLDVMLPDLDGFNVCRFIRNYSSVPIIMVTAKGTVDDQVYGLNVGADDYITKPFSSRELVARVSAAIRRGGFQNKPLPAPILQFKDLQIDLAKKVVTLNREVIDLSPIEYRILSFLAINCGRIVSPEEIIAEVWGGQTDKDAHVLQVNLGRLRIKLKDDIKGNRYIETKVGMGYLMTCDNLD
jgi:DNA-binding response OmpR family regulator